MERLIGSSDKDQKTKARLLDDDEVARLEAEERDKREKEKVSK